MSEPKKNDWTSPGALFGALGLVTAGVSAYTSLSGRVTSLEASAPPVERRLDRFETKLDYVVEQVARMNAEKGEK